MVDEKHFKLKEWLYLKLKRNRLFIGLIIIRIRDIIVRVIIGICGRSKKEKNTEMADGYINRDILSE